MKKQSKKRMKYVVCDKCGAKFESIYKDQGYGCCSVSEKNDRGGYTIFGCYGSRLFDMQRIEIEKDSWKPFEEPCEGNLCDVCIQSYVNICKSPIRETECI